MSGLEAPKIQEAAQQEAPKIQEAPKTQEAAQQEVKDVLESEETKVVLDKMKKIEDYLNNIQGEELKSYKWIILEYKSIKDDIQKKMEEDPNFQEAMKQVWEHLDKNDQPLDAIGEPDAWKMAWEVLGNNETQKQLSKIGYVVSSGYDMLNPNQQEALNKWLADFKDWIENVALILGIDQRNNYT